MKRIPVAPILFLALALGPGCKKKDASPDAGPSLNPTVLVDPGLGLELTLPPAWRSGLGADAGVNSGPILLDLRRTAEPGAPVLVAPRMVVGVAAADDRDLSTIIDDELMDLRHLEDKGTAKIDRVTKGHRTIAGQEAVEMRVDFRVVQPGAAEVTLTQREWVFFARDKDKKKKLVTLNVSNGQDVDERLGREAEDVLRSVHLLE
ncbi:MAG: hypothetical protein U1E65_25810 [Myxococcota bacterium]